MKLYQQFIINDRNLNKIILLYLKKGNHFNDEVGKCLV